MALVKPLHSGDPDVMCNSHAATCIRSDLHAYVTRNRIQPRSLIVTWGGAAATQVRSRMATKYGHSNGSFHRVLACSAGGPGFGSPLRRNILRWLWSSLYSTILTHIRANLVPVSSRALLMDLYVLMVWCAHVAYGYTSCAARESLETSTVLSFW
jgi:hypothetical protein